MRGLAKTQTVWPNRGKTRHVKRKLTGTAKALRRSETIAERKLWSYLRNRQIDGWKFKRQVPFGRYVLDFLCFDANLVVEVDGYQHLNDTAEYDRQRTGDLERQGLKVLRIWNADVMSNIEGVLEAIYLELQQQHAPSPGAERKRRALLKQEAAPASPRGERRMSGPGHERDN